MKKSYHAGALILALLAMSGLAGGQEIEELHLITALAVDRAEAGVVLTALTGVRASEDREPQVLTGEGSGLEEAVQDLQAARASQAYLGQADKLLLGEDLAGEDLLQVLEFVLDHRDLRLDTLLYIVKGNAGEGLAATAPSAAGETPGRDRRGVTVGQALSRLCEGKAVRVPALAAGEEGLLAPAGWALVSRRGLVSYLTDGLRTAEQSVKGEGGPAYG